MVNKIKQIYLSYKIENQKLKAIEELSELIIGIAKNNRKNIIEEIADVEIMVQQLKFIYLIDDKDINEKMIEKIERQLFRIKSEAKK